LRRKEVSALRVGHRKHPAGRFGEPGLPHRTVTGNGTARAGARGAPAPVIDVSRAPARYALLHSHHGLW
jgi:hypothetical protein